MLDAVLSDDGAYSKFGAKQIAVDAVDGDADVAAAEAVARTGYVVVVVVVLAASGSFESFRYYSNFHYNPLKTLFFLRGHV